LRNVYFTLLVLASIFSGAAFSSEEVWIPAWRETAALTIARAGAAVLATGDYLYAIGGVDGIDFLASVEYAPIHADGTLGPWRMTHSLTEPRGFFDAVAYNGYIYAVGGGNGPNGEHLLRSVERAPIRADGSLGRWQQLDAQLNVPRRCVKLLLSGPILYALGGFGGTLLDTIESTKISVDGGLRPWQLETERLTTPRYVNTVKKLGQHIYVLGGHKEQEGVGMREVEFAALREDHSHGAWRAAQPLTLGRFALAAAGHGDFLYALGGLDGARYVDTVEVSRAQTDGSLSAWRTTTPLASARANFASIVYKNRLYIVGGTNRDGYFRTVEYAGFDAQGDIGFMGTASDALEVQKRQLESQQAQMSRLPNAGVVRERIQTSAYTYLKVDTGGVGEQWIAGPRIEVELGDQVRYSRGVEMGNFYSRTLNRNFASILFVERLERAAPLRDGK
jgi:hypothetical protein